MRDAVAPAGSFFAPAADDLEVAARMFSTRLPISFAARRVNVSSRIREGLTPLAIRYATRWASVLVFPVPAPAMISSGPFPNEAAASWAGLREVPLSIAAASMPHHPTSHRTHRTAG